MPSRTKWRFLENLPFYLLKFGYENFQIKKAFYFARNCTNGKFTKFTIDIWAESNNAQTSDHFIKLS